MAHIHPIKGKNGTSHKIEYYVNGKKKYHTISYKENKTIKEIKRIAAELELKAEPPDLNDLTLGQFYEKSLENFEVDLSPESIRSIKNKFKPFLFFAGETIKVNLITHHFIHEYKKWLFERNMEKSEDEEKTKRGVNASLNILRWVFNEGYKQDLIKNKIFDKVTFLRAQEYIADFLTKSEARMLYKHLPARKEDKFFYVVLKYTGMRRNEVLLLKEKDMDIVNDLIILRHRKNKKPITKPMHLVVKKILMKWEILTGDKERKLFTFHHESITKIFRRALNEAGLEDKKAAVHILRHTYGTRIMETYQNDLDSGERLTQELLGHKNIKSTRRYTHLVRKILKDKHSKVKF